MEWKDSIHAFLPEKKGFRHEYKHEISYGDFVLLQKRLSLIMEKDPHVGEDGSYRICSLYFDNLYDKALQEKRDGISCREKFRIRCYDNRTDLIKLEKKVKNHGLCGKLSCEITKEECQKILDGDIQWMAADSRKLMVEFYMKMRLQLLTPKVLVTYRRIPYIYSAGNVRVTLDFDIRSGLYEQNLFRTDSDGIRTPEGSYLLEVKYDAFLPELIGNAVQMGNRHSGAFSKYAACRVFG